MHGLGFTKPDISCCNLHILALSCLFSCITDVGLDVATEILDGRSWSLMYCHLRSN